MSTALKKFWQDESGVTAIEYGLIAGLLAVVVIAAVTAGGGNLGAGVALGLLLLPYSRGWIGAGSVQSSKPFPTRST